MQDNKPIKLWREGDMILNFGLTRIKKPYNNQMAEWLDVKDITLSTSEQELFDKILQKGLDYIEAWSEEDLKMKFIAHVLEMSYMVEEGNGLVSFFDKLISSTVEGIELSVKSDFMLATGVLDAFRKPYFHFQEYKPQKNPAGDSMAQLLMAFLIAQSINQDDKPLYGAEVIGRSWAFVAMQGKEYCVSQAYDCTKKQDLLSIIGILRKFKTEILPELIR